MSKSLGYQSRRKRRIPVEWVTFTISFLIVAALVALVLFAWRTQGSDPPILSVERGGEIRVEQGQFYVPFTLKNTGGITAESVQVVGELRQEETVIEAGEQQIDFLSGGEEEEGAFIFSRDPRRGTLTLRVASYKLP